MTRPLTVTLDGRTIFDEVRRGTAQVTIAQYRALAELKPAWRFRVFYQEGTGADPFADLPNVSSERLRMRGDRWRLWPRLRLPLANLAARPDLFHAPAGVAPRYPLAPLVVTLHDLIPIDLDRGPDPATRAWIANVRRAARRARAVITGSEHARGRIVALLGVRPEKVHVIPWAPAAPPPAVTPARVAETRQRYGGGPAEKSVLHFGMGDPRKNTAGLIRAWASLPAETRASHRLLIVGVTGAAREEFVRLAQSRGLTVGVGPGGVGIYGYVPDEDAATLLAGSCALAYPTLYEGFGLPILDAFAAGVPVLACRATSVPEVAGDAALLVEPGDEAALAGGLAELLHSPARREACRQRGLARVTQYSWRRVAERTARVLAAAASAGVGASECE